MMDRPIGDRQSSPNVMTKKAIVNISEDIPSTAKKRVVNKV
jgi:hypothetical protein